jgi:predicted peptidase
MSNVLLRNAYIAKLHGFTLSFFQSKDRTGERVERVKFMRLNTNEKPCGTYEANRLSYDKEWSWLIPAFKAIKNIDPKISTKTKLKYSSKEQENLFDLHAKLLKSQENLIMEDMFEALANYSEALMQIYHSTDYNLLKQSI